MRKRNLLSVLLALVLVLGLLPMTALAAPVDSVSTDKAHFLGTNFRQAKTGWQSNDKGWWYNDTNGSYVTGWQKIGSSWYYFDTNGYMQTGWQKINGSWYYFETSGTMVTGWKWIGNNCYYFYASGAMAYDTTIDGFRLNRAGIWVKTGWQSNDKGWWYNDNNGVYVTGWKKIGSTWYYFATNGYMQIGWQKINGSWYYFESSGAMVTGWKWIGNNCYYFYESGAMAYDTTIDGFRLNSAGIWVKTGWQSNDKGWWYNDNNGVYVTGWKKIGSIWYYFDTNGYMQTDWQTIDNTWYYFESSGAMVTGWKWIGNNCYYFYPSGAMAYDTTIDGSYVDASGKWLPEGKPSTEHVHKWKRVSGWENLKSGYACNGCSRDVTDWEDMYDCCGGFHTHQWWLSSPYYVCETCGMKKHEHTWSYVNPTYIDGTNEISSPGYWMCWRCGNQSRDGKTVEPVSVSSKGFKRGAINRWVTPFDFAADDLENWVFVDVEWEEPEAVPSLQSIRISGTRSLTPGNTGTYQVKFTPASAAEPITWSSSNPAVVSIDNAGNYVAHAVGTVKITATTSAGIKDTTFVRVTSPNIGVVSEATLLVDGKSALGSTITLSGNNASYPITLRTTPEKAVYEVRYSIEDEVYAPGYSPYNSVVWVSGSCFLGNKSEYGWETGPVYTNPLSEINTGRRGTATIVAKIVDLNGNVTVLKQPVRIK